MYTMYLKPYMHQWDITIIIDKERGILLAYK